MGILSNLLKSTPKNCNNSNDDYVSDEDYNYVQGKFREMKEAQDAGDNEKAQRIWDGLNNNK